MIRPALVLLAGFLAAGPAAAQTISSRQANFKIVTVAENLSHPWSIAFLPDGGYLVTEREGNLLRLAPDGSKTPVKGVPPVATGGQSGLFDVVLSPDFETSGLIYLSYAGPPEGKNNTELARAVLDLDTNTLSGVKVIFRAEPKTEGDNHYGARLLFAGDHLYLTLGDRYKFRDEAQNVKNHLGTIVRLMPDGGATADNPFKDKEGAKPEIYSYGHRNVQGLALQPGTNRVWAHEHGPRGGDEVNILNPGANYGWPAITYGIDYSGLKISDKTQEAGMEQPVIQWTPSIAPSGMAFYEGDAFPDWRGDLFVGALAGTHLRRLEIKESNVTEQEVLLAGREERIRDVRTGPDGFLYILTDETEGKLMRLEPSAP